MIYPRSSHGVTFQPQTLFKCLLSLYSALVVHNRSGLHSEGYIRFKEDRYSVDMINPRAQNGGRGAGGQTLYTSPDSLTFMLLHGLSVVRAFFVRKKTILNVRSHRCSTTSSVTQLPNSTDQAPD